MTTLFYYEKSYTILGSEFAMAIVSISEYRTSSPPKGYSNYSFDPITGNFSNVGPISAPGEHGRYNANGKSLVESTYKRFYDNDYYYSATRYGAVAAEAPGDYIETIYAESGAFPENGKHTDGFWYIKKDQVQYMSSGSWQSDVIDLGAGWIKTTSATLSTLVPTNTSLKLEACYSSDKLTFSEYASLDASAIPNARYLKIRAILAATPISTQPTVYDFDQSNEMNKYTLNDYVEADGQLKLKTSYMYEMTEEALSESDKFYSATINKKDFKSIEKLSLA